MEKRKGRGYLVLAGISGLPSNLAGMELEHANELLDELQELVIDQIYPFLQPATLERDQIFAYAPEADQASSDTLQEVVEAAYIHFKDWQKAQQHALACTCQACRRVPHLDLKFWAHYGEYRVTRRADILEIGGPEVELLLARKLKKMDIGKPYRIIKAASYVI